MKDLLNNIDLTRQIMLYTTLLSNTDTKEWEADVKKLIDFMCAANNNYNNDKFYDLITYEVSNMATLKDVSVYNSNKKYNADFTILEFFYDLKAQAIITAEQISHALSELGCRSYSELNYDNLLIYNSENRRIAISEMSRFGDVYLCVLLGLMYSCGIGGEIDLKKARLKFLQAAYWGYIPAFRYAAYISDELKDEKNKWLYGELYTSCSKFLSDGITIVPIEYKNEYSKDAMDLFSLVSSIYFDVVILLNAKYINYSFVEVMLLDDLSLSEKMKYVNEYQKSEWKEITNGSKILSYNKFGFNV